MSTKDPVKRAEHQRRYYQKNREEIIERGRRYRAENPEKVAERNRKYWAQHGGRIAEQRRRRREENPQLRKEERAKEAERQRQRREEERERALAQERRWWEENRELHGLARRERLRPGPRKPWTPEEDVVVMNLEGRGVAEMARMLNGRTYRSILARRHELREQEVGRA